MTFFRSFVALLTLMVSLATPSALRAAEPLLPLISTVILVPGDPVEAKKGNHALGLPEFALRTGATVRLFANNDNCAEYVLNPGNYPDAGWVIPNMGLYGADPVALFPEGVHSPTRGSLVAGDPANHMATYKEAKFAFVSMANRVKFEENPAKYELPLGGYCAGAMAQDRVTPGDPRNLYYVAEVGTWAVFGSPNGPIAWAAKTQDQRRIDFAKAQANYLRRTGLDQQPPKVAVLGKLGEPTKTVRIALREKAG